MYRLHKLASILGGVMLAWGLIQAVGLRSYQAQATGPPALPFAVVELFTSEG